MRVVITRSNPIAPDPRVEKAAAALTEAGYRVFLLGWDRSAALPRREEIAGADCIRLPIQAQFGHGLGNFWPLLRWQWGLFFWLTRNRREYEIIHACDFDTVLPALICKTLFGNHIIYDIFDFYADHLRATPGWVKALIRALDLWAIRRVDALIVTDESRWAQVGDRLPENRAVILNTPVNGYLFCRDGDQEGSGVDLPRRDHTDRGAITGIFFHSARLANSAVQNTRCEFTLRLVFVGLLQIERGLLDVLALLATHSDWHLDLAGFGGDEGQILEMAESLPNLTWHGRIPYERALALTAAADVVLALYDPVIENHRYASPNKLYEAMMLGKPVIVAADTNIDRIVREESCGLVIAYGHQKELAKALERLQVDRSLRQQLGQNGRTAYNERYNWDKMKARLAHLYAQIT